MVYHNDKSPYFLVVYFLRRLKSSLKFVTHHLKICSKHFQKEKKINEIKKNNNDYRELNMRIPNGQGGVLEMLYNLPFVDL